MIVSASVIGVAAILATMTPALAQTEPAPSTDRIIRENLPFNFQDPKARAVEQSDLAPLNADEDETASPEAWQRTSKDRVVKLLKKVTLPPASLTLMTLWKASVDLDHTAIDPAFTMTLSEALERSGLPERALNLLNAVPVAERTPRLSLALARLEAGLGNADEACRIASALAPVRRELARTEKLRMALISGYCAAVKGDDISASLQASLAHDTAAALGQLNLSVVLLDAVSGGLPPTMPKDAKLGLIAYRIATLKKPLPAHIVLNQATPALLATLANATDTPRDLKLAAAEKSAVHGSVSPQELAALYRQSGIGGDARVIERAALFKQVEAVATPLKKARLMRAFIDELTRVDLSWVAHQLMAAPAKELRPVAEIEWFGETAAEIGLASGDLDLLRQWTTFSATQPAIAGRGDLTHWLALADLADPAQPSASKSLQAVERLAKVDKITPNALQVAVAVFDALRMQVPIPLWELASRARQSAEGNQPDPKTMTALKQASEQKSRLETVLLVMDALGPKGPQGAHRIALGDSLRALIRAGMAPEARRVGLEALFYRWPRTFVF